MISIATAPVRGMEDVYDGAAAAATTEGMIARMWDESVAGKTGSDLRQGFNPDQGALVVNPPSHREFHQLHAHAGAWRTATFDKCLAGLTASAGWQATTRAGLSEGNEGNCNVPGKCQSATLAYKTVTSLAGAWADYKAGLQILAQSKAIPGVKRADYKYFASLMATRGLALGPSQWFVMVYAPASTDMSDGLGRGHFLMKGAPGSNQHPTSC